MAAPRRPGARRRAVGRFVLRNLVRVFLKLYFRWRVTNLPDIPEGFVLVSNHASFIDTLVPHQAFHTRMKKHIAIRIVMKVVDTIKTFAIPFCDHQCNCIVAGLRKACQHVRLDGSQLMIRL